jgi:hypothetical protein
LVVHRSVIHRLSGDGSSIAGSVVSTISLVDLAGSERQKQSGAEGERLREMVNINLSLTTLRRVIQVLYDNSAAIIEPGRRRHASGGITRPPLRDSLLTHALSTSFGGNSKSFIILTLSPCRGDWSDTHSTLEFGSVARRVVNHVTVNEDRDSAMLRAMAEEVENLKQLLKQRTEELNASKQEVSLLRDTGSTPPPTIREGRDDWVNDSGSEKAATPVPAEPVEIAGLQAQLSRAERLFNDVQEQLRCQAETNSQLMGQLKDREEQISALDRLRGDVERAFLRKINNEVLQDPELALLLSRVKEPLQSQPGCPECHSHLTEVYAERRNSFCLQREVDVLKDKLHDSYVENERLRRKLESVIAIVAEQQNELNRHDAQQTIVEFQRGRIECLEAQIEHHVEDRVNLLMATHRLEGRLQEMGEASHSDDVPLYA